MRCRLAALLSMTSLGALGACAPLTLSIGLGPTPRPIHEVLVWDEPRREGTIALLDVRGMLMDAREPGLLGSGPNPVDVLLSQLARAERDPRVKAIVLRINSPGGTVTSSDILYREIRRFQSHSGKPVVASLGEVAASGGYYIALAADEIVAEPTSITGSIGVIIPLMNFSGGLAKLGVESVAITSGPNKDMGNPFEARDASHEALYQGLVDSYYARFRNLVVERRPGVSDALVGEATDGRVVTGARALELGLVDSTGGIREAFEAAKARAGLSAARLVKYAGSGGPTSTAYASVDPAREPGRADAGVAITLFDLDAFAGLPTNAYYVWAPSR